MPNIHAQLMEFDNRPALLSSKITGVGLCGMLRAAAAEQADPERKRVATNLFIDCDEATRPTKPFQYNSGVAIIPITGVLLNRYPWVGNYASGYGAIRQMIDAAVKDNDVAGIVLDVNSFGGMAQGCFELSEFIYEARKEKPILSIVDANSMSAAYAIASAATKVSATRSADIGSIGVLLMHVDLSKMLEEEGIKVTYVFAGEHKVDGNPFEPLPKDVKKDLQISVNDVYEEFVACVARNRGLSSDAVRETEARVFNPEDALRLGLIDNVSTPVSAFAAFLDDVSAINIIGDQSMSTAAAKPGEAATPPAVSSPAASPPAVDTAAISAEAKSAERKRINEIMSLPEAKDRQAQAHHLALSTDLSPEVCKGILAAAPVPVAPAAAAAEPDKGKKPTAFDKAMQNGNPDVPAEGNEPAAAEDPKTRILKNYQAASGVKLQAVK